MVLVAAHFSYSSQVCFNLDDGEGMHDGVSLGCKQCMVTSGVLSGEKGDPSCVQRDLTAMRCWRWRTPVPEWGQLSFPPRRARAHVPVPVEAPCRTTASWSRVSNHPAAAAPRAPPAARALALLDMCKQTIVVTFLPTI